MFLSLDSWFNYPKIMDMAVFCAIPREKEDRTRLKEKQKYFSLLGYRTEVLDIEPLDISSSLIREKIKKGENLGGLLPKSVEEYIRNNKLYV
jgi:nicotinate-nucleotide adenylyltransferase